MTRSTFFRTGLAISALSLSGCATLNGVPQSPCQRATRAAAVIHASVAVAQAAGDPAVIERTIEADNVAQAAAVAVCAVVPPAAP